MEEGRREGKASEIIVVDGKVYHLGFGEGQIAKNIILVGNPKRAERVAEYFSSWRWKAWNREYVTVTGVYGKGLKRMPVSVIGTGMGTDNIEIGLVEAYLANEFDLKSRERKSDSKPLTIIRCGTSGGLQRDVKVGSLAISTYGLGLDSTGLFYDEEPADGLSVRIEEAAYQLITNATPKGRRFKGKIFPYVSKPSDDVVAALIEQVELRGKNVVTGITATASGFYGPQGREIPGLKITVPGLQEHLMKLNVGDQRVVNFEMESGLLFHLARQMRYRAGTVCAVLANRQTGSFLEDYSDAVDSCIKVGLEAMYDLWRKDG